MLLEGEVSCEVMIESTFVPKGKIIGVVVVHTLRSLQGHQQLLSVFVGKKELKFASHVLLKYT